MRKIIACLAFFLTAVPLSDALATALQSFKPTSQTVQVAATTTAQSVTLVGSGGSIRIYNNSASPARVELSGSAAATPAPGTPGSFGVAPNSVEVLELGTFQTTVSVKLDSGAGNVEFTRGEGL